MFHPGGEFLRIQIVIKIFFPIKNGLKIVITWRMFSFLVKWLVSSNLVENNQWYTKEGCFFQFSTLKCTYHYHMKVENIPFISDDSETLNILMGWGQPSKEILLSFHLLRLFNCFFLDIPQSMLKVEQTWPNFRHMFFGCRPMKNKCYTGCQLERWVKVSGADRLDRASEVIQNSLKNSWTSAQELTKHFLFQKTSLFGHNP